MKYKYFIPLILLMVIMIPISLGYTSTIPAWQGYTNEIYENNGMHYFIPLNITDSIYQNIPIYTTFYLNNVTLVNMQLTIGSSVTTSYQITLSNNQNVSTPSNFQQLLQLNLTSLNINNIGGLRFYDQNNNPLYAWLESYNLTSGIANIWINLSNNIIPANGYLNITMKYNIFNNFDGVYWGEAPQLSSIYAQYDNGQYVFNNYWNFAGTSLPSGLVVGETGGSYSVNNGLTVTGGSNYEGIFMANPVNPQTNIIDIYGYLTGTNSQFGFYGSTSAGRPQYFIWSPNTNNYSLLAYNGVIGNGTTITTSGSQTSNSIWSIWASNTSAYASYNYGLPVSNNANFVSSTSMYGGTQAYGTSSSTFINWLRTRAYPPNGVMPTISNISTILSSYVISNCTNTNIEILNNYNSSTIFITNLSGTTMVSLLYPVTTLTIMPNTNIPMSSEAIFQSWELLYWSSNTQYVINVNDLTSVVMITVLFLIAIMIVVMLVAIVRGSKL